MKRWTLLLFGILLSSGFAQQLHFRIMGYDGQPPARADILIFGWFNDTAAVATTTTGVAKVQLPAPGNYMVVVAGTYHLAHFFPALFLPDGKYSIVVRLRPLQPSGTAPRIAVVAPDRNIFRDNAPLHRIGKQTFQATLPVTDGIVQYQIVDTVDGSLRSFNGTQSDAYEFDGSDYISVLRAPGKDSVTVTVDFSKFPTGTFEAKHEITLENLPEVDAVVKSCQRFYDSILQRRRTEEVTVSCEAFREQCMQKGMQRHKAASLITFAYSMLLDAMDVWENQRCFDAPGMLRKLIRTLPPSHWLWGVDQSLLDACVNYADSVPALRSYLPLVALSHPRRDVQAMAMVALIKDAYMHRRFAVARDLIAALRNQYGKSESAYLQFLTDRYDPDNPVAIGKRVPFFRLRDLDDSSTIYMPQTLKGKYVLIDFWATWCGPCIAELPYLHKAYETFKDKNFTILSISFDARPDIVRRFRQSPKHPMPWHHAFAYGGFRSKVARDFRVRGIPKPILIDPDGTIIALEGELRGRRLLRTLQKHLSP